MRLRMICYDISEDAYRNKVADLLLRYGCHRMQKSVFAGRQGDADFLEMKTKIDKIMCKSDDPNSSIYYIIVSHEMFSKMDINGDAPDFGTILDQHLFLWI